MCFGGGGGGGVDQEGLAKNREIEKTIKADQKKAAREVKLLLLGEQFSPFPVPNSQLAISSLQFTQSHSLPPLSSHNCRG
jgi:hypothetical protein